jgi:hypothetical protein
MAGHGTEPGGFRGDEKMAKFYDSSRTPEKRISKLFRYMSSANETDLRRFFQDNYYDTYNIFLDCIGSWENHTFNKKGAALD